MLFTFNTSVVSLLNEELLGLVPELFRQHLE